MPLTDSKLRSLNHPGKHFDGGGMYLEVTVAGGRYWRLKYRFAGKEKRLAFGVYPEVTLKEARARRDEARKLLDNGADPGAMKQAQKAQARTDSENTFETVARDWIPYAASHARSRQWTESHRARSLANFVADVFPYIGHKPMAQVTDDDVKAVIKRLNDRGVGELASRTYQRIGSVFKFAVTEKKCIKHNPLLNLERSKVVMTHTVFHARHFRKRNCPVFSPSLRRLTVILAH